MLLFLVAYQTKLGKLSLIFIIMKTINIHEAKTHLSRLVEQAATGEHFVIAKAGKPMVKVVSLHTPDASKVKRIGFMATEIAVPEDFDRIGCAEIENLFECNE